MSLAVGARRALPIHGRALVCRAWAAVALIALAALVLAVVVQAVSSITALALVLVAAALLLGAAPVAAWFAVTTRSAWKRMISGMVGLIVLATVAAIMVLFTLVQLGGLILVLLAALAFRAAARRAVPAVSFAAADPVSTPARPWLLVNPWSGGGTAGRVGLASVAEAAGFTVHELASGDDPVRLARMAVADGADVLAVAGGDGTLALVAGVAVEANVPFLCVPAGTRNHFARDLGLDRSDPLGALQALGGREVGVDVAFVGDRLFLNNVSLGAYADAVAEPSYRSSKLNTSRVVLRRLVRGERDPMLLTVRSPDGRLFQRVQVLQVSNNRYNVRRLGARDCLDAGLLQVSALLTNKGSGVAALAARAAVGRLGTAPAWAQWSAPTLTVDSPVDVLAAGVDGEAVRLEPPLEFRVVPQGLRVLVPAHVPPWVEARRRQQAIPALWRLAIGRDRAQTGPPATIAACPLKSAT